MLFLVNPAKKRTRTRKRKPSAKQLKARKNLVRLSRARAKARRLGTSGKTRRKGAEMAVRKRRTRRKATVRRAATRRKRRVVRRASARKRRPAAVRVVRRGRTVYASNPRRRRRTRRNPSFSGRGILGMVTSAAKDGLAVLGGMAGTNFVARKIPFGEGNQVMEIGKKVAVAIALGMIGGKALGRSTGEKLLIGGIVAIGADLLRNVPVVGTSLAGDADLRFIARTGLSAYPLMVGAGDSGMGAYASPGIGGGDANAYRH